MMTNEHEQQVDEQSVDSVLEERAINCDVCGNSFSLNDIEQETKHGIHVSYHRCTVCQTRHEFTFEDKRVRRVKAKMATVKRLESLVKLEIQKETLRAKDKYYRQEYKELTDEEIAVVGEYVPYLDKDAYKQFVELEKTYKLSVKELLKLL